VNQFLTRLQKINWFKIKILTYLAIIIGKICYIVVLVLKLLFMLACYKQIATFFGLMLPADNNHLYCS